MTAKPGEGGRLVDVLLSALEPGGPASTEWCLVYLVSRSASDPDVVLVQEGWTSVEDHDRVFAGDAAQAILAQVPVLLAGEPTYGDFVPVDGKAGQLTSTASLT